MKLSIVRLLAPFALSATLCTLVMAAPNSGPKPGGMNGEKMGGRMRGGMMGRMMKGLNLTPAQQAKMKVVMEQRLAIRQSTTLSEDQKRAKMMAFDPKINAILTPEQRKKFATMMAERRKQWGQGGGQGGGRRMNGGMGDMKPRA